MNREYIALASHSLKAGASFVRPSHELPERVTLEDPALSVMTDLKKISVITVRTKTPMDRAHEKMKRYAVRTLLVLDEADKVAGLLTATDILGEKPMRFLQQMGGAHADILVRDIMTPQRELEVLNMQDVVPAKVGHILAVLKVAGRQHAMVVEENANGSQAICGMFSASQVARQLDMEKGNLYRALGRYNGSLGRPEYPNLVKAAWHKRWTTPVLTRSKDQPSPAS